MTDAQRNQFIDKVIEVHKKRKLIADLTAKRREEEKALMLEYKVDECNAKRNAMAVNSAREIEVIMKEIKAIEDTILE